MTSRLDRLTSVNSVRLSQLFLSFETRENSNSRVLIICLSRAPIGHDRTATLVIAPTFFSAALYWSLGLIIALVAPTKTFVSAKWFKIIFVVADVVSLGPFLSH